MIKKCLRILPMLFVLGLFAGCDNGTDDTEGVQPFYDDVGEMDIELRERVVRRRPRSVRSAPAPKPAPEAMAYKSQHPRMVGEIELEH